MIGQKKTAFLLALPWLVTFIVFWLFPLIYSFIIGFTNYELMSDTVKWVGFENYKALLSDEVFLDSLSNTFIFVFGTIPFTTIIALFLALLVNGNYRGRDFFRSAFFMPSVTSMVVIALIFTNLYQRGGYIAMLAQMLGFATPEYGFLFDKDTALYSIMAMDIWMSVGYYMLIFLAGLKSIPEELYEAADISGASPSKKFFAITLPLLRPVALFILVVNSIKSFQVFQEIFIMTKGKFDTSTAVFFIYDTGLTTHFQFGYVSAAAYILFVIIGLFSLTQFLIMRRRQPLW